MTASTLVESVSIAALSVPDSSRTSVEKISKGDHPKDRKYMDFIEGAVLGFADGLTVPFALTAGLSSVGSWWIVILGGVAELFSGSISMGLGAYLAAITDRKAYAVAEGRRRRKIAEKPAQEEEEIYRVFEKYELSRARVEIVVEGLKVNSDMWVKFIMDFSENKKRPDRFKAVISGLVMGFSYFLGGLIPMIPYFAIRHVTYALFVSIGITIVVLIAFGYVKAKVTGTTRKDAVYSAVQTLLVGAVAAGMSYGIVRGVNSIRPLSI